MQPWWKSIVNISQLWPNMVYNKCFHARDFHCLLLLCSPYHIMLLHMHHVALYRKVTNYTEESSGTLNFTIYEKKFFLHFTTYFALWYISLNQTL
jgi:hypothetical protein